MTITIDSHVHIYDHGFWSPRWFDFLAHRWAHGGPVEKDPGRIRPRIEEGMADPDASRMIADMDAAEIDVSVILTLDWELGFGQRAAVDIQTIHRRYAEMIERHPTRLVAFAGVDPRRADAVQIFEWAIKDLGMKGLKLYPPTGFYPHDKVVYRLYERCEDWQIPILIHTGGTIGLLRPRFANPIYLQDVQADFPRLTLWFGHAGGKWWTEEAITVASNGAHSYLEVSNWDDIASTDEERLVKLLGRARDRLGAHRLLFGSDHFSGERFHGQQRLVDWASWIRSLPDRAPKYGVRFTEEEVDQIMGLNAARCLRLEIDG